MFDTVMRLQRADPGDPVGFRQAIEQIELLLELMDGHANHEDHFILHPMEERAPILIQEFESEHVVDLALSAQLRQKIAIYHEADDKEEVGRQLYYALNAYVAFNLQHMNKEEQQLNQVLWAHYSDQELLGVVQKIKQSVRPDEMKIVFEWMVKGLNNVELLQWLNALKRQAPAFVLRMVVDACCEYLPAARWQPIKASVGELDLA